MTTCNDCNGRREYWTEWGDAARRDPSLQHLVIEVDEDEPYALIHCQCAVPPAAGAAAPDPQPWPAPTGEPYTYALRDCQGQHIGVETDSSILGVDLDNFGVNAYTLHTPTWYAPPSDDGIFCHVCGYTWPTDDHCYPL